MWRASSWARRTTASSGRFNGKPGAIIAAYQLPGSNAVDAAAGVKKLMSEDEAAFPAGHGLRNRAGYHAGGDRRHQGNHRDAGDRARAGHPGGLHLFARLARDVDSVAGGAGVAGRAPSCCFRVFGFSINTLSLFGLVLAIGLVVDDAIVVVEASSGTSKKDMTPKAAALKAMEEISGPVVGIALVLSAVFVPTAFIPGITGRLYQQFAMTIAISVLLSAFNALTLSPALAALLLRPKEGERGLLTRFFDWFNRFFER